MSRPDLFDELISRYINEKGYSPGQISKMARVPKASIVNWMNGRVKQPRGWSQLLKVARVLGLDEAHVNRLLLAAAYPPLDELMKKCSADEAELLSPWMAEIKRRQAESPFLVIGDHPHFVGRSKIIEDLSSRFLKGPFPLLVCIQGMGGLGKTALAVHLAHRLRPFFADGVLMARLDSSDLMSTLSVFAEMFGRDVNRYASLEARSSVVRELLSRKKVLIILDNVQNSEEISPFLPATGECVLMVTTRKKQLSITRPFLSVDVPLFDPQIGEDQDLFVKILGQDYVDTFAVVLRQIAEVLGYLPLALDIAASRLKYEPNWDVSQFRDRLMEEKRRLNELHYDDLSVRAVFNLSYASLQPPEKTFFASLGVFPGSDFAPSAAAYLLDLASDQAADLLRKLYGLSLVQIGRSGRYRLHPLLRDFAREHVDLDTMSSRAARYYIDWLDRHRTDYAQVEKESSNILGLLNCLADGQEVQLFIHGVVAVFPYCDARGLYNVALGLLEKARRLLVDLPAQEQGEVWLYLGIACRKTGQFELAARYLAEGLQVSLEQQNGRLSPDFYLNLGGLELSLGNYGKAKEYFERGLDYGQHDENEQIIAALLANKASVLFNEGDYLAAQKLFNESLQISRETKNRQRMGDNLQGLGAIADSQGDYETAQNYYRQSLEIARELGHQETICTLLSNLAGIDSALDDLEQASQNYTEGINIARSIGHVENICLLLTGMANLNQEHGQETLAETQYQEALDLAEHYQIKKRICEIKLGLGILTYNKGHLEEARIWLDAALNLAQEYHLPWFSVPALRYLGKIALARKDLALAFDDLNRALGLAGRMQAQEYIGLCQFDLAQAEEAAGQHDQALKRIRESLDLLEKIQHREAHQVRAWYAQHFIEE
jgi:tetratricopeptide (TPR) repeat protein